MVLINKRRTIIFLITLVVLLIPFIAMQLTGEVNWSTADFLIAGLLLFGLGLLIEMVLRKTKNISYRIAIIIAIILAFLLVWAELAVGIFGTPFSGS